jgi:hypothetical protein
MSANNGAEAEAEAEAEAMEGTGSLLDLRKTAGMTGLCPAWGLPPRPGVRALAAWGARAIYKIFTERDRRTGRRIPPEIDLLWDRQEFKYDALDPVAVKACKKLQKWINTKGIKKLSRECSARFITGDCSEVVEVVDGDFMLIATPRASYGYLYIGAWISQSQPHSVKEK